MAFHFLGDKKVKNEVLRFLGGLSRHFYIDIVHRQSCFLSIVNQFIHDFHICAHCGRWLSSKTGRRCTISAVSTAIVEELIEHIFTTIKPAFYWPTIDAERIVNHETGTCKQKLEHLQQLKLAVQWLLHPKKCLLIHSYSHNHFHNDNIACSN